ncbi:Appr-1-p processing domain protein, putative [Hepatocystis sp. ex Piliocolobus tephrosceles]|nr:Appr-1-p processing domain protein, putative [Hepatocystis sp. ex Piliocolobus tephrosceles]
MFFFKLIKKNTVQIPINKVCLRFFKTKKNVSVSKLIKNKKIKENELYNIEDIELLLNEKRHEILNNYPIITNVNKIINVNDIPVFRKNENAHNILNKIALHFGDLSYLKGDVVVNGTNKVFELTKEGNGYDCAGNFLKTCGDELFDDIKKIRKENESNKNESNKNIIITKGYNSAYNNIIHVVEPYYNETEKLKDCYNNILLTAKQNKFKNIVFPLLGSGISLFKKQDVVTCCLEGIYEFLKIKNNFNSINKIILTTITDSYWMLLRDSLPLYLDTEAK